MSSLCRKVILGLAAVVSACTADEGEHPVAPGAAEQRAQMVQISGDVRLKRAAADDWVSATDTVALYESDRVATAKGASAVIRFANGSSLTLKENSFISIADGKSRPGAERNDATLHKGHLEAELKDPSQQSLSVGTPAATVRAGREIIFQ